MNIREKLSEWRAKRRAKALQKKLPRGYRDGEFIFSASTVDAYLEKIFESNNNPLADSMKQGKENDES